MKEIYAELIGKEIVAENTLAIYLKPMENFNYKAGQFVDLIIENAKYGDERGNRRTFSIASSPTEENLLFAMRIRDTGFKRNLMEMNVGDKLKIFGPMGIMTLPEEKKPLIFLSGGIGITPFRSIIKYVCDMNLSYRIYLFYSNKKLSSFAFLNELEDLSRKNENFHLISTLTGERLDEWKGEYGRINIEMIEKYVDKSTINEAIFYIAGPGKMAVSLEEMLENYGIGGDRIKKEIFTGY